MEPKIIEEAKDYVVLNKPAGLLMHGLPNKKVPDPTLADWVLEHFPETEKVGDEPSLRPGIVHRLDKDTSGVVLVARTAEAFARFKLMFQNREMRKTYLALVRGHLDRDRSIINKSLGIKPGTTKRSVHSAKMSKEALTEYRVLERAAREEDNFKSSYLELIPHTGRTHQLRVHLMSIGHPILGDSIYGPKLQPEWVSRFMLHSNSLEFSEEGKTKKFTAPPDKKFRTVLKSAGIKL